MIKVICDCFESGIFEGSLHFVIVFCHKVLSWTLQPSM